MELKMIEKMTAEKLAGMIDHTSLKATATYGDIEKLCNEARQFGFYSVCVNPAYVSYAKEKLKESKVKVCTVAGFPLGMNTTEMKEQEALYSFLAGADEVDMVINVARLKEKDYYDVQHEIKAVVGTKKLVGRKAENNVVKVIIETCYLTPEEIVSATTIVNAAGADYIKTSTGFGTPASGPSGATVENVKLMKDRIDSLKSDLKIKAAGGISNLETALAMINAGASRLGCSKSVEIINELLAEAVLSG